MTKQTINVSLRKLTAWKGNVRKTDADAGIDELAASIAAHGLLQSLVVRPDGKNGKYAVIAGRRRLLALKDLAKDGTIEADADIPCRIASSDVDPTELSLAENVVRVPMHPADQFEAFSKLIDKGAGVAEVAARFGVAESVVAKRLKLGRLSPTILAAYREEQIGLEQAQAFALSDDPEAQERVYEALSHGHMSPASIRRALTEGEIPADDRRVIFVGVEAYVEAGGALRRDLFDQDGGGYILDESLLDRLVTAKLAGFAGDLKAEGWKWVQTIPVIEYGTLSEFSRLYPETAELSESDQAELDRLSQRYDELIDSDDDADAERIGEIEGAIEALNAKAEAWPALTLAIAGAVIALDRNGEVRIERGLVRKEDERIAKAAEQSAAKDDAKPEVFTLPATLVADLTAQKTAAIRNVLSQQPDIALATIVHTLALALLYPRSRMETCLELKAPGADLRPDMAKPDACTALTAFEQDCERWRRQVPANPADLWDWCIAQSQGKLLELLALCVALSVNAVRRKGDRPGCDRLRHADMLVRSLGIDMNAWFTPDAANYFGRINRAGIFEAIREAKGSDPAPAWAKIKKSELAQIATRQVAGTGWLPEPVRIAEHSEIADEPADEAGFEDAESEAA